MAEKDDRAVERDAEKAREIAEKQALLPGNDTFVQCVAGPYRGLRIQMTDAEADAAESEGWGYRLPANIHEAPPMPERTPEEGFEVAKLAHAAAVDLRNEEGYETEPSPMRHRTKQQHQRDEEDDNEPTSQPRSTRAKK